MPKRFKLNKIFIIFEPFSAIAYLQHIHIVSSITYRHDNAQPINVTGCNLYVSPYRYMDVNALATPFTAAKVQRFFEIHKELTYFNIENLPIG